jgi:hypothetical protein
MKNHVVVFFMGIIPLLVDAPGWGLMWKVMSRYVYLTVTEVSSGGASDET